MKKKELSEYFAKIGRKGGRASGETKKRGDSEYYRQLVKKRKKKK